jgi:hypothetical protein
VVGQILSSCRDTDHAHLSDEPSLRWAGERRPFELPHFCYAQRLLEESMITIVADFRSQVVKFLFGGRNSGQKERNPRWVVI